MINSINWSLFPSDELFTFSNRAILLAETLRPSTPALVPFVDRALNSKANYQAALERELMANPSGVKGVCPTGWHLPSDPEWTTLSDCLINNGFGFGGGGDNIAKLLASTFKWYSYSRAGTPGNDLGSNNRTGFSALPGGYNGGDFYASGYAGYWWSSTAYYEDNPWCFSIDYDYSLLFRGNGYYKNNGFSVRCIRD
jgi:uncharacterized protein (TIGR02145 family)